MKPIQRTALAALVVALSVSPAGASTVRFVMGPLVQMPAAGVLAVVWQTDVACAGRVLYGTDGGDDLGLTCAEKEPSKRHEVMLPELAPDTTVRYRVTCSTAHTGVFEFRTPPPADGTLEAIVLGDTRSAHWHHQDVVHQALDRAGHVLINTGDLVGRGDSMEDWRRFFAIEGPLLARTLSFAVVGNHDRAGGGVEVFRRLLVQPASDHAPERDFAFDAGPARFVVLDNAVTAAQPQLQRAWLTAVLAAGAGDPGIRWQFVAVHQGVHSNGPHGPSGSLLAAGLDDVMRDYDVALVMAGHDHLYERGVVDGLRYMVSGGGGAPVYHKTVNRGHAEMLEPVHHLVDMRISPEEVTFSVVLKDGSVLETCGFDHEEAGYECL